MTWRGVVALAVMARGALALSACRGVFDGVDLDSGALPAIEARVNASMAALRASLPWLESRCSAANRKNACMLTATESAAISSGLPYCYEECLGVLRADCRIVLEEVPSLADACEALPRGADCVVGGTSSVTEPDAVCPKPLVLPDSASFADPAYTVQVSGSACFTPCPNTLVYEESAWRVAHIVPLVGSYISAVLVCITLVTHIMKDFFAISMLCLGCAVVSIAVGTFSAANLDDSVTCSGNAGYVPFQWGCVLVGAIVVVCSWWLAAWSCIIAASLMLSIAHGWKRLRLRALQQRLVLPILACPTLGCIVLVAQDLVGYEATGGTLAVCLYRQTESELAEVLFYVVSWTPIMLFTVASLAFMVRSMAAVYATQRAADKYRAPPARRGSVGDAPSGDDPAARRHAVARFLKFNKKQLVFVFAFIGTTVFTLSLWLEVNVNNTTHVETTEDYVACLLSEATLDANDAAKVCGDPEYPDFYKTQVILVYGSAFGCIPFLIFGAAGMLRRKQPPEETLKSDKMSGRTSAIRTTLEGSLSLAKALARRSSAAASAAASVVSRTSTAPGGVAEPPGAAAKDQHGHGAAQEALTENDPFPSYPRLSTEVELVPGTQHRSPAPPSAAAVSPRGAPDGQV